MSKTIDNKQIFNKIVNLIYKDKKRIIIALIVSIASYYFALYPTDRLSYIVDGIAGGNIDFNGVVNEILRIVLAGIHFYIVFFFKDFNRILGFEKVLNVWPLVIKTEFS